MSTLENAIALAVEKHRGQRDKAGMPYILHPLRMMCRMRTEAEMMVAILHDLVEDTDVTLEDLQAAGFSDEIMAAIDCLTRRNGESYEEFTERIKPNPLALQVKLADLEDNMDIRRLESLGEKDVERLRRYQWAWRELTELLDR